MIASGGLLRAFQSDKNPYWLCPQSPCCPYSFLRDAITKMKDVYLKNPQMGDPASLDHKLAEVTQNIERLRLETQKFEVWGTGAKEGAARGRVTLGRHPGSPPSTHQWSLSWQCWPMSPERKTTLLTRLGLWGFPG